MLGTNKNFTEQAAR